MIKLEIFIFAFLAAGTCFGQRSDERPFLVGDDVSACESNPVGFSMVARKASEKNERVFIIFRAGIKETESTNRKRLRYVRRALLDKWATINKLDILYALGEKSSGKGKIEFYVGGRLTFMIIAPTNMTPCLDCCGDDRVAPKSLVKTINRKRTR